MASLADAEEALRSTNAKSNFQRLTRLLMSGGVILLREKFNSIHSPTNLPITLSDPAVKTLLRRTRITTPEWNCLYPSPGVYGKSSDFDITLTFRLLRTICNLSPPHTGWDNLPNDSDHTLEADLARIKWYRNKVYGHSQNVEIPDAEFVDLWGKISEALLRIAASISHEKGNNWKKAIEKFLHEPLTPAAERYAEELTLWYEKDMDIKRVLQGHQEAILRLENTIERLIQSGLVVNPVEIYDNQQERPAEIDIWNVIMAFQNSFNLFFEYLENKLNVFVQHFELGSLSITVECSSLQILEGLWADYSSGHLNKVAQETMVTDEVLRKLGLDEVKLKTFISEEEYEKGKQTFRENSVFIMNEDDKDWEKVSFDEVKDCVEKNGVEDIKELLTKKLEGWKEVEVNIGITGDSGTGKSSFINSIRGPLFVIMGNSVDSVSDQEKHALEEVKQLHKKGDSMKLKEYLTSKLEEWKDAEINFAITGDAGTGKSSFINSIRGLYDDDKEAAEVGVVETTREPASYDHPTNPKVKFWDLPGIGTPNYPDIEAYSEKIQLTKYDVFLIFVSDRFTENALILAKEIQNIPKKFFFIRTKIDADVRNEKQGKRSPLNEDKMLEKIRQDISRNLKDVLSNEQDIFLLSNHYPDKWDYDRLTQAILDALPAAQQESIILSLGNVTSSIFTSKVNVLKRRLWKVAGLSGVVAVTPVPGLSFAVDVGLILNEFKFYRNQLGLPEAGSTHFASLDSSTKEAVLRVCVKTVGEVIKYMYMYAPEAATEEVSRYIPLIGPAIAGTMSFAATYIVLKKYLEDVKNATESSLKQAVLRSVKKID